MCGVVGKHYTWWVKPFFFFSIYILKMTGFDETIPKSEPKKKGKEF